MLGSKSKVPQSIFNWMNGVGVQKGLFVPDHCHTGPANKDEVVAESLAIGHHHMG